MAAENVRDDFCEIFVCPVNIEAVAFCLVILKCVYIYIELALRIVILLTNLGALCLFTIFLLILDAFVVVFGAKDTFFGGSNHKFVKGVIIVQTGKENCTTSALVLLVCLQVSYIDLSFVSLV